jgi:hypothetical protein
MKKLKFSLTIDRPHDDTSKFSNDEQNAIDVSVLLKMCDRDSEMCLILVLELKNLETDSNSMC